METIIVQLSEPAVPEGHSAGRPRLLHLAPGDAADFGRGLPGGESLAIELDDPGISRRAGRLEAAGDY